jgi:acetyltransferase-like isoleucine patch superfamily enzyme
MREDVKRAWRKVVAGLQRTSPTLHEAALRYQLRGMSTARKLRGHQVGAATYGSPVVLDFGRGASLSIGDYTSIGGEVVILLGGEHDSRSLTTYPFSALWPEGKDLESPDTTKGDVRIGHDVWIGQRVTILSGVTVGDGAIVGAGSLVARDVPPYAVAAGNPCRVLRMRFEPEVVDELLRLQWWSWPRDSVARALTLLTGQDVVALRLFAERENLSQT